ncbi:MAG: phosphatase PAP2 family protein [Desulfoferrobacter sp.]
MRNTAKDFLVPLLILVALTMLFRWTDLDLKIESLFYSAKRGWIYRNDNPWMLLYEYGAIPAIVLAVSALTALLVSFRYNVLAPFRRQMLFILLTLLVGPGLIVNLGLKENWGRPRPREVVYFGGQKQFEKVWEKGPPKNYSFPSGHAAIGFFIVCPYFILRSRHRNWANAFLIIGLVYGSSMGLARMIQGQHFPSDVIWSGGLVYLSAAGCYYLLGLYREDNQASGHCLIGRS